MSTRTEDARHIPHDEVSLSDITIGVVIGRTTEFFDFFVFSIASVLVFPALLFPFASPVQGTLMAFAVLALGFMARPVGTILFTYVHRRYGAGPKLTSALFLLGTSSVGISFLPSYQAAGWLTIAALIILRVCQGIAAGGSWDGLSSLLAKAAPPERKGRQAILPQLGAPIGLIMAAALFIFLKTMLSDEEFLSFGWRYPFFVVFATNVVALFARVRMVVSPEFKSLFGESRLNPRPPFETIRAEAGNIAAGALTPLASSAMFHMVTLFPLAYVVLLDPENTLTMLWIELIGALFGFAAIMWSGVLADRIGRLTLLRNSAIVVALFAVLFPIMLGLGTLGHALYVIVGSVVLGLSFGQSSGAVASGFNPVYRYTASNLTADLAWLLGAGFAPFVALWLTNTFGLWSAGVYLLSGALCTIAALTMFSKRQQERRDQDSSWR